MSIFADLPHSTLFLSDLQGTPIRNHEGRKIGQLSDLFVNYEDVFPEVLALAIKHKNAFFYVFWEEIESFSQKMIVLKNESELHRGRTLPRVSQKKILNGMLARSYQEKTIDYPALGRVILDRQIVDTNGRKVVRVNDIHLIKVGSHLRVTHAATGLKSMIRRLGYAPLFHGLKLIVPPTGKIFDRERLISWKFVHALPDSTMQKDVKLNVSDNDLKAIHPADLADILEELDGRVRQNIIDGMSPELAAQTLSEIDQDLQESIVQSIPNDRLSEIVEHMGPDEAADLLSELDKDQAHKVISSVEDREHQEEIKELLNYDEKSAGGLMSTEMLLAKPHHCKQDILNIIQEQDEDLESIYDLYIVNDNDILIGTCSLRKLLTHKNEVFIEDLMEKEDIKYAHANDHWQVVAEMMSKYNLINLPILDQDKKLLGIISVDDVLPWLLDER